ncbi:MAG: GNAT family N-acetyltransferase [Anaerolineae bacterium]|nr:GNAT family N-acetyltransferase [Anaerolineae bacterium]
MVNQNITIHPVSELDIRQFVKALNTAYADYHVPIQLTRHTFLDLAERESVSLDASCAAVDNGKIVGMGLLGLRQRRGWIGGMGVIPTYRRQGIGRTIMQALLERAWALGLDTVQLEVITDNTAAYTLYQSLGFRTRRLLLVLNCTHSRQRPIRGRNDLVIQEEPAEELVEDLAEFAASDPSWQTEIDAQRLILPTLYGLSARQQFDRQLSGICFYQYNGHQGSVTHLCAANQECGSMLLSHLLDHHRVASFSYLNVPENDPMLPPLEKAGFKVSLRQYEMILANPQETRSS